jgi:DNA-binding beta-propeller fold protein YncE
MNHKSLYTYILVLIFFVLALALPTYQALSAEPRLFTPSNHQPATLVLGQPNFTSRTGNTSQAGMSSPSGVAVDPTTGKVFVSDATNNRVQRFASIYALFNGAAAEGVLGQADFTHGEGNRGGSVEANTMNGPYGIFVDSAGTLWVADIFNNRVLRFNNAAAKINGADANSVLGQADFTHNSISTTQNGMHYPIDLFLDASGRLYVADDVNSRVLRFDSAAAKANGANADGVLGQLDFTSSSQATTQNGMARPRAVYVDSSGRLWVAELSNNRVLRFDNAASKANGANADGVLGQPDFTSKSSACNQHGMYSPMGETVDSDGRLYVSDTLNSRVLVFENAATKANGDGADYVLGQANFTTCTGNSGSISAASLVLPTGLTYDQLTGVLWVTDDGNSRVLMFGTPPMAASLVLGQPDFTSSAWNTGQTGMAGPYSMAVDPLSGKVFVSDFWQNRVLRFASVSALSNGAAAESVLGQADFSSVYPNRGGSTAANSLYYPKDVFVDSAGRLWVADSYNNRILRFDHASAKALGAAADGLLGQALFSTSSSATTRNGMNVPTGLTVDSNGRLWVGDLSNNRVLRFDNAAAKIMGANADGVLGQASFTTNGHAATRNGMYGPTGLFTYRYGMLFVADAGNNRVLFFYDTATKPDGANADGVLGQPDFTSANPACSQIGLRAPGDVSGDDYGRLYVADTNNNRVLVYSPVEELPNGANAISVLGQPDFSLCTANTAGLSASSLYIPTGIFFDLTTRVLWVADNNNDRVLMYGTPQFRVFVPLIRK